VINQGKGPSASAGSPFGRRAGNAEYAIFDDFTSSRLTAGWQWPQASEPVKRITGGRLALAPVAASARDVLGAVVARTTTSGDYTATTAINLSELKPGTQAGLAAYGDHENALGIAVGGGKVTVWRREKGDQQALATMDVPRAPLIYLRMTATGGDRFRFAMSRDGQSWKEAGEQMNGNYLPPWDRAVRVALTTGGGNGATAKFEWFRVAPSKAMRDTR
jgi:hypothetical protein